MFLTTDRWRSQPTRDGSQRASGMFLVLVQSRKDDSREIRAFVRKVNMVQIGHFMMGACRIAGEEIVLSGTYGSDGLPKNVPHEIFLKGVEVPPELVEMYWKGGGWNSAGSEATSMRKWATENIKVLYRAGREKK